MYISGNKLYNPDTDNIMDTKTKEKTTDYDLLLSFSSNKYLLKTTLGTDLSNYLELLLCLCSSSDTSKVLGLTIIPEYDINKMIDNYEFTDGSYTHHIDIDTDMGIYYEVGVSFINNKTLYVTSSSNATGYLFGKPKSIK